MIENKKGVYDVSSYEKHMKLKALFPLSYNKDVETIINKIINLQDYAHKSNDQLEVACVLMGEPLLYLTKANDDPLKARLLNLGVQLKVCNNALKSRQLTATDLEDSVQVVVAGVGEIIKKQTQGWVCFWV